MTSPEMTATELANTLVDVLKGNTLDKVLQEAGTLPATQGSLSPSNFVLNRSASQMIVMLNWLGTDNAEALDVRFIGPDGQQRSATESERGDYHAVKSIEFDEETEVGQWGVQVVRRGDSSGEVDYQMTVLADEHLFSHEVAFANEHTFTGESISLQLALSEGGRALTGLDPDQIEVEVRRPRMGLGSFFSDQQVPREVLTRDPDYAETDPLGTPAARKVEYLQREGRLQEAVAHEQIEVPEVRGGRPANEDAFLLGSEGVYTLTLTETTIPGTYEFRIRFEVETERSGRVSRVVDVQREVDVLPNLSASDVEALVEEEVLRVRFTPRDLYGNDLGLGYDEVLDVTSSDQETPISAEVNGDAQGNYELSLREISAEENPTLIFRVRGRPYHAVTVDQLVSGDIPEDPNLPDEDQEGQLQPCGSNDNSSTTGLLLFAGLMVVGLFAYRRRRRA